MLISNNIRRVRRQRACVSPPFQLSDQCAVGECLNSNGNVRKGSKADACWSLAEGSWRTLEALVLLSPKRAVCFINR